MEDVRNSRGKLVCRINPATFTVEIVSKGQKTIVVFDLGNKPRITYS